MADVTPALKAIGVVRPAPGDAMQMGVHSALNRASKHKRMVGSVLEMKKMSAGHRSNPSAYHVGARAFKVGVAKKHGAVK